MAEEEKSLQQIRADQGRREAERRTGLDRRKRASDAIAELGEIRRNRRMEDRRKGERRDEEDSALISNWIDRFDASRN